MNGVKQQPHRFSVGSLDCVAFSDGSLPTTWGQLFANADPDDLRQILREHGTADERPILHSACLLIETGGRRILIDTGAGPHARGQGRLHAGLREAGVAPEAIDTVVLSHAHRSRAGGALDRNRRPAFPNARYVLWREEWDFWTSGPDLRARGLQRAADTARDTLLALRDRLDLVERGAELAPGVTMLSAPGHTAGHMGLLLASGRDCLLYLADAALHPLHCERPEWYSALDLRPEQSVTSRLRLLDRAVAEDAQVFAPRFAFPGLGRVAQRGEAWQWLPGAASTSTSISAPADHPAEPSPARARREP